MTSARRPRRWPLACLAVFATTVLSCAESAAPPSFNGHTVQITRVSYSPSSVHCGFGPPTTYLFLVYVYMVNTTPSPATLLNVSSAAPYVQNPVLQPPTVLTRSSLPFTPLYLRANDGSNYTVVSIGGVCPSPSAYGSFYVTLFLTTDTGQYATSMFTLSLGP
jgi:hypothetical protein